MHAGGPNRVLYHIQVDNFLTPLTAESENISYVFYMQTGKKQSMESHKH